MNRRQAAPPSRLAILLQPAPAAMPDTCGASAIDEMPAPFACDGASGARWPPYGPSWRERGNVFRPSPNFTHATSWLSQEWCVGGVAQGSSRLQVATST